MAVIGVALVGATAMVSFAGTEDATTVRVSVSTAGEQGDAFSRFGENSDSPVPVVSNGGRFITFESDAANLVSGDTNLKQDIFVRNAVDGTTTRVSVGAGGVQGDHASREPSISADGRYVAFSSGATNLVPDDTNGRSDVFVRDVVTGTTTRVSVAGGGAQAGGGGFSPSISADGRYVTFGSEASNLVPGDTNSRDDVFLRDLVARTTTRVTVSSDGEQSAEEGFCALLCTPNVSNHGRYVVFASYAPNLVPGDTNNNSDIFVRDVVAGTTTRASVATDGTQAEDWPYGDVNVAPSITADGRYVFFTSMAQNLVPGDDNGKPDVFRRDMVAGVTTLIKPYNTPGAHRWSASANGRYLCLISDDLDGTDGKPGAFIRDLVTGATTRVSVSSSGEVADGKNFSVRMSPDGRSVAFTSDATNLVEGDTNKAWDIFLRNLNGDEVAGSFAAPTGRFALNPTSVWPGQAVTVNQVALAGNGRAPEGIGRVVLWGDGSAPQTLAAGATTATHVYPAAGSYRVQVVLVDQAGNRTEAGVQGSSTVVVKAPTGKFTLNKSSIWATQSVSLGLTGVSGADKVAVAWGDGTSSTLAPTATRAAHTFAKAGTYQIKVTLSNAVGAGEPVVAGSVKASRDTFAPVVALTTPKNAGAASSWAKLTGTATDRGLGVAAVRVRLVEKRGAAWFYYNGTAWKKAASQVAAQQKAVLITVTPGAKGGWSRAVKGITKGTLKITYSGVDKAANAASAKTLTRAITK